MAIKKIKARKVVDSRGNPTIEVDVITDKGISRAAAPSGASTGEAEANAFPESVDFHVRNINNKISKNLTGLEPDLLRIDRLFRDLDGTDNFSKIGGNPAVAISMAVAKAEALDKGIPLWKYLNKILNKFLKKELSVESVVTRPLGNVLGGGAHAVGGTDIQEFLVCSQVKLSRTQFLQMQRFMEW